MSRDHKIPAMLIGRMSTETNRTLRARKVWVQKVNEKNLKRLSGNSIGWKEDYYDVDEEITGISSVDPWVSFYETDLRNALDQVIQEPEDVTLETFIKVLVPFAASLFARSESFRNLMNMRLAPLKDSMPQLSDINCDVNHLRDVEMVRLFTPLMRARWRLIHFSTPILLSDQAMTMGHAPLSPTQAEIFIPIDSFYALRITPQATATTPIATMHDGQWKACIETQRSEIDAERFNRETAAQCETWCATSDQEALELAMSSIEHIGPPIVNCFNYDDVSGASYELEWFRLVTAIDHGKIPQQGLLADHIDRNQSRYAQSIPMPQCVNIHHAPRTLIEGSNMFIAAMHTKEILTLATPSETPEVAVSRLLSSIPEEPPTYPTRYYYQGPAGVSLFYHRLDT